MSSIGEGDIVTSSGIHENTGRNITIGLIIFIVILTIIVIAYGFYMSSLVTSESEKQNDLCFALICEETGKNAVRKNAAGVCERSS